MFQKVATPHQKVATPLMKVATPQVFQVKRHLKHPGAPLPSSSSACVVFGWWCATPLEHKGPPFATPFATPHNCLVFRRCMRILVTSKKRRNPQKTAPPAKCRAAHTEAASRRPEGRLPRPTRLRADGPGPYPAPPGDGLHPQEDRVPQDRSYPSKKPRLDHTDGVT